MPAPLNPNLWAVVLHDEDGIPISPTNPLPISASLDIQQVQHVETEEPLDPDEEFNGAARDCEDYESFGISVYLEPEAGEAVDATVVVENSIDGSTWRTVDTITLSGAADAVVNLNRVYSVTRQFYRVSVTNNDSTNALAGTEVVSMLKPI